MVSVRPVPSLGPLRPSTRDELIDQTLRSAGCSAAADRAYLFSFHGSRMTNTHEWCRQGIPEFKAKLTNIPAADLPVFAEKIASGQVVVINSEDDVEDMPLEARELREEGIHSLALVPVKVGEDESQITGFLGFDSCRPLRQWLELDVRHLCRVSSAVAALLMMQDPDELRTLVGHGVQSLAGELSMGKMLSVAAGITADEKVFRPRPLAIAPASATELTRANFAARRWDRMEPESWGIEPAEMDGFVELCQRRWAEMEPDIAPYTAFRDVGYARYRYYRGDMILLRHKPFFQVDPLANVLLADEPRPFNRMAPDVREHPVLLGMLRTLLEDVWCDLGDEVHINVHPVRIRNFHEGKVHGQTHVTLEGTHVDSTERVAVVLIDRNNCREGVPKTALYKPECPMGKRRDLPEDEAEIAPLRLTEVVLTRPLEAITFDDTCFKHDAQDFEPDVAGEPASRCVMLIMARRPFAHKSPLDGCPIDGYTPRSC